MSFREKDARHALAVLGSSIDLCTEPIERVLREALAVLT